MTGCGPWPGRKRLAGFLATAVMVGWSVALSGSAVAKDACSPERAEVTFSTVPDTTAFGSGTIAYNRQRPDASRAGIWVADADGANPRLLADAGSDAAWSPDGRRIVYYLSGVDSGVWVADADGGDRRWLVGGYDPAWSPNGKHIAFADGGELSGIWVVDADGGNQRQLTSGGSGPQWSPDG
ncbi:MAG: hypothetical protein OXQ26_04395, partial [bacterium]|nr:hypothetical protein [bacterium]